MTRQAARSHSENCAPTPPAVKIAVLGATGSIGQQSLSILERHPRDFRVEALTAHTNLEQLYQDCLKFKPSTVVVGQALQADELAQRLKEAGLSAVNILVGSEGLVAVAQDPEIAVVIAGVSGFAGVAPVLAAVESGKLILLANKESAVVAGHLLLDKLAQGSATILPVDSEHNGIFQCLLSQDWRVGHALATDIDRLIMTASGGPFLHWPAEKLAEVSPSEACAHPNWQMGRKISVDSATMANKALELIECCRLFAIDHHRVDILIHPQSLVHAMISHRDGSLIAQLSQPDMRVAIAHALSQALVSLGHKPKDAARLPSGVAAIDWLSSGSFEFEPMDYDEFPPVRLAKLALDEGSSALIGFNAINEELVERFLHQQIRFDEISSHLEQAMKSFERIDVPDWEHVCEQDRLARVCLNQV